MPDPTAPPDPAAADVAAPDAAPADAAPADGALPLAGLAVVELEAIGPVPFAGLQLGALGATVSRVLAPAPRGIGLELSPEADLLNLGKPVRRLDLKSAAGREALHALLDASDVLLEGFRPGVLERLGLAPETLLERHPRLVVGRLPGFGATGPLARHAGHDINFLALSGALAAIGPAERPAVPLNLVADFGGGAMQLVAGTLAALVRRGIDGRGSVVSTSLLAGTLALTPMLHGLLADGRWRLERAANALDGGAPHYGTYRTLDGRFVAVGALERVFFERLLALLGLEGSIDPDRRDDPATWDATRRAFATAFAARTRDAWAAFGEETDCCLSPVLDLAEALRHPQVLTEGLVAPAPFAHPASPVRFTRSPDPSP